MDKPISVKDYVRELLDVQAKSYRSMIEMVVNEFREDLKALKKDVNDLKASIQFTQKDVDENKQKVSEIAVTIAAQATALNDVFKGLDELEGKSDYLENQSRRNNIKVFGIPEEHDETWDDCESKIKEAIAEKLDIKEEILIERAHRVGPKNGHKRARSRNQQAGAGRRNDEGPRPIVAKLQSWKQKSAVIKDAQKKKPKDISFKEDFSNRVLERRAQLIPEMLSARAQGRVAYLVMDRLVVRPINGRPHGTRSSTPTPGEEPDKTSHESNKDETESEVSFNVN